MSEKMIKAGITHGDANGISYELILKMLSDLHVFEICIPVVYGSTKIMAYHRKMVDVPSLAVGNISRAEDAVENRVNVIHVVGENFVVELGKATRESAKASDVALAHALNDLKAGTIDVLITAPSVTDPVLAAESKSVNEKQSLKILINDSFRLALATGNVTLNEVPNLLSVESLTKKIIALRDSLIRDFQVTFPRIAVLALNPKGKQENITTPAIRAASDMGVLCFGPYAADDFFASNRHLRFDAVLAMYHDQGMIAFNTIVSEEHALFIGNLPYIITMPDIHVSFDRAGKNEGSPNAIMKALFLAIDIYNNRQTYKQINTNPLKRQHFNRSSDNEKPDLTKGDI
jgi:4-hydroxythreonine-4-phosphate dehydrogenase